MPKPVKPSNLELQVLTVLWDHGPLPVRSVLGLLPDSKKRAYTSVLSVMQVMEKKGLLHHQQDGNRHIYFPRVKRGQVMGNVFSNWVKNLFGGSAVDAMQMLLESTEVSRGELQEMKRLLESYEEETGENAKNKPSSS